MKMQNSNRREIDQLENYLSVDIDEKALAKLYRNIKIVEAEITEMEVKI